GSRNRRPRPSCDSFGKHSQPGYRRGFEPRRRGATVNSCAASGVWRMSMSIKGTDPILGPCRGDPNAFFAMLVGPDQKDHDYVFAVHHWAGVAGVDDAL